MIVLLLTWIIQVNSLRTHIHPLDHYYTTEAGVIELSGFPPTSQSVEYEVVFRKQYRDPPKILVAFHSFEICPRFNHQLVGLSISDVELITATQFVFKAMQDTIQGEDSFVKLKVSYFIWDSYSLNLAVQQLLVPITHLPVVEEFVPGINISPSTFIGCYPRRIWCSAGEMDSHVFLDARGQYAETRLVRIYFHRSFRAESAQAEGHLTYGVLMVNIPPSNNLMTFTFGEYNHVIDLPMSFDPQSSSQTFFIGLQCIGSNHQCINTGLSEINNEGMNQNRYPTARHKWIRFAYEPLPSFKKLSIDNNSAKQTLQFSLQTFLFHPSDPIVFTQSLGNPVIQGENVTTDLLSPFQEGVVLVLLTHFQRNTLSFSMIISFRVFSIIEIDVNPIIFTIGVQMINIQQDIDHHNLIFDFSKLQVIQFFPNGINRYFLKGRYSQDATQTGIAIQYKKPGEDFGIVNSFKILTITSIIQSATSKFVRIHIVDNSFSENFDDMVLRWKSTNVFNEVFGQWSSKGISCSFIYTDNESPFEIIYTQHLNNAFSQILIFSLIQVRVGRVLVDQDLAEIEISHLKMIDQITQSDFQIPQAGGPTIKSISHKGNLVVLTVDITHYVDQTIFSIIFSPKHTLTRIVYENVRLLNTVLKQTIVDLEQTNQLKIILNNVESLPVDFDLKVGVDLAEITLINAEITTYEIIITFSYSTNLHNKIIVLSYDTDPSNVHTLFQTQIQFQIPFYSPVIHASVDEPQPWNHQINIISIILSGIYLSLFLLSVLSCNKMYGIQLIYLIQLSFYSLVPLNMFCSPYEGLKGLRYSIPLLPWFNRYFEQVPLPANYAQIGIQSNFFSNVNVFLLPFFALPLLYLPMVCIGNRSQDLHTKPRCLRYGKSMLFQLPLTILLFNSFNIYSSLVVTIQAFRFSNIAVSLLAVLIGLLLPFACFYFYKLRDNFVEFRKEFNSVDRSWLFEKSTSINIRRIYPLAMMVEFILVPLALSLQSLAAASMYMVLTIEVSITLFVVIVPLYEIEVENVRNYVHRGIILSICILQIVVLELREHEKMNPSVLFWLHVGLLVFLFLGILCTGTYIIYKSIRFITSPPLIDTQLFIKNSPNLKPHHALTQQSEFIPISQFVFKQIKKSQLTHTPRRRQVRHLQPQQKIQLWFDQIGEKDLFTHLGIDKYTYVQLRKGKVSYIEREWFVRSHLNGIPINDLLVTLEGDIVTLEDLINYLGGQEMRELRKRNTDEEKMNKLEDEGI